MVFPVVMYGFESWTIKKAEPWKIDAFELWCWRRLLRVPWTARRLNQFLKEISPEHSLEGLMLKLKLQYFGQLMWRTDSLEKTMILGKIEGRKRRRWHSMKWLDGFTDSINMSLNKLWKLLMNREAWCAAVHWVKKCQTRLSNWIDSSLSTLLLHLSNCYSCCVKGFFQVSTSSSDLRNRVSTAYTTEWLNWPELNCCHFVLYNFHSLPNFLQRSSGSFIITIKGNKGLFVFVGKMQCRKI